MVTGLVSMAAVAGGAAPVVAATTPPAQLSSGVVRWGQATWRAVATQPGGYGAITVTISRETAGVWRSAGQVRLNEGALPESGDLGNAGDALYAAGLTGLATPDFVLVTQDLGPQPWFSVISAVSGNWHLVPVDFGYGSLIGVPAAVKVDGRSLRVQVGNDEDVPGTTGWYRFSGASFAITEPPGPTPPCDTKELGTIPLPDGQGGVPPSSYACLDGWALVTGIYQTSPYFGLFNWQGSTWQDVGQYSGPDLNLDDAPMWYGIPLSVLQGLGDAVGPAVAPDVAAAAELSHLNGSTVSGYDGSPVVVDSGVVRGYSQDWLGVAAAALTGSGPDATIDIFSWDGASWSPRGTVRIGYFGYLGDSPAGGGLVPEALTGSPEPDFALNGSGADTHWFAVISDVNSRWQGVPFDWVDRPTVAVSGGNVEGSTVQGAFDACGATKPAKGSAAKPPSNTASSGPASNGPSPLARSICGLSPAAQRGFLPAHADGDGVTSVLYDDPNGTVVLPYHSDFRGSKYTPYRRYVLGLAQMSGSIVESAMANFNKYTGQWEIDMAFTAKGSSEFNEYAAVYYACYERDPASPLDGVDCPPYGDQQAIDVDGSVEAAPAIESPSYAPGAVISGGTPPFTAQQARELADLVNYGALPERLVVEEISTVTPVAK